VLGQDDALVATGGQAMARNLGALGAEDQYYARGGLFDHQLLADVGRGH
jgi:hypothetical protein